MPSSFKPIILSPNAVAAQEKQRLVISIETAKAAKRIEKTLGISAKTKPLSIKSMTISVDDLRKSGIKTLHKFGVGKAVAKYVMGVLNAKTPPVVSGNSRKKPKEKRPLGFDVPNGPFSMICAAYDAGCYCDVSWPGGGMCCPCF